MAFTWVTTFYADNNGTNHIINTGGGTSRISVGYGTISLLTGDVNFPPSAGLTIDPNGDVGIGTTTPDSNLEVAGDATVDVVLSTGQLDINPSYSDNATWSIYTDNNNLAFTVHVPGSNHQELAYINYTDGYYFELSDVRLKRDITNLDSTLDRLLQLRPVSYHFRSAPAGTSPTLGLIAQEVEPLFPEVVGEHAGMKSLAYSELVPVTIRAIQELNQKLEDQLKQQQAENAGLKQRLDALKKIVLNQKPN